MPKYQLHMQHQFRSSPDQVFDFFADHEQFGRIWPGKTRRVKEAEDEPNGEGSVREVKVGPVCFEETTVVHQRPHRIEYAITRGGPLRNHRGVIMFEASDGGCLLDYRIEYDSRFPFIGGILARNLPRDFKVGLAALRAELP